MASATVALGALTATSAVDGTYTIENVPPSTSGTLTATKAGYEFTSISIAAMSGNLTGQNITTTYLTLTATTTGAATVTLQQITPTGGACAVDWGDTQTSTIADGAPARPRTPTPEQGLTRSKYTGAI